MGHFTRNDIEQALRSYSDPHTRLDLVARKAIVAIDIDGKHVEVVLRPGYPAASMAESMKAGIAACLQAVPGVEQVKVSLDTSIEACGRSSKVAALDQVRNIIAVTSGKGGVGKSATAANLAVALQQEGASVGLLDADIYGPSLPLMMGIPETQRPEVRDEKFFLPIEAHGLQTMSIGYLVTEKTPMIWRGPMVSGALTQMINQTVWRDLDFLLIDMPPGTGDIQLTLAQQVPVTAAVVVTTPQDIALLDARKGIEMFAKVEIPCLGIVENMAMHTCSQCGHTEHVFGEGGGQRIAEEYGVPLLGSLPLDLAIRESIDAGDPVTNRLPDSGLAEQYRHIAREMGAKLCEQALQRPSRGPTIVVSND